MHIKTIPLTKKHGKLYGQVYHVILNQILQGSLQYQDRLPSIRACATSMQVSKTSIERAYQQLVWEGWIVSIAKKGYFVNVNLEEIQKRKIMLQTYQVKPQTLLYDLRTQSMDIQNFDTSIWLHYIKQVVQQNEIMMHYGDAQGEFILRNALKDYLYAMRGVFSTPDQLIIGSSMQSLLALLCAIQKENSCIVMEKNRFLQMEQVFLDYGFSILYVHEIQEVLTRKELLQTASYIYVNTASYGKMKQAMDKSHMQQLIQLANLYHCYIIEDDYNGEVRYTSSIAPAMQAYDNYQCVIYVRSFSKLILPSIRLSVMVLPQRLLSLYEQKKRYYNATASKMEQVVFAHYILDSHFEKRLRKLCKQYQQVHTYFYPKLQAIFYKATIVLEENRQVYHIYLEEDVSNKRLEALAAKKQLAVQKEANNRICICFSALQIQQVDGVLQILEEVYQSCKQ